MDVRMIIAALNSDIRREILMILFHGSMNVKDTMKELEHRGVGARYRETVYRALEMLSNSGLVEKHYEKERGLCYRLISSRIIVEIESKAINISSSNRWPGHSTEFNK